MQIETINEHFAEYCKKLTSIKQPFINFWCSTNYVTIKNEINPELIGLDVEIAYEERILVTGKIMDIQIHSISDTYEDEHIGGNDMLGLPANYNVNDFVYEISETYPCKNSYTTSSEIASIIIKVAPRNTNRVGGNQKGRKKR